MRSTALALLGLSLLMPPRHAAAQALPVHPEAGILESFASASARVFRGRCLAAEPAEVAVAGGRVPVTVYTFEVLEGLKGPLASTVTFRQVGHPEGGPRDLGRLAGLPVYRPGAEYVLFLLPESRAGLTSPAGAAEAALVVGAGGALGWVGARHGVTVRGVGEEARTVPSGAVPVRPSADPPTLDDVRRAVAAGGRP